MTIRIRASHVEIFWIGDTSGMRTSVVNANLHRVVMKAKHAVEGLIRNLGGSFFTNKNWEKAKRGLKQIDQMAGTWRPWPCMVITES